MRTLTAGIFMGFVIAAVAGGVFAQSGGSNHNVTKADLDRWKTELSNWGRWGKDDQIGTLNLITPAKRKQAATLVKEGFSVSLARDAMTEKAVDVPNPYEHTMLGIGGDKIAMGIHGVGNTHLDSLGHVYYDGVTYNGYAPKEAEVMKAGGHARNSIYTVKNGIFTRGVLIDIPRLKGVKYLEPGTPIYVEDVEAWLKQAGLKIMPGDALFLRTGRWSKRAESGPFNVSRAGTAAGFHASIIPWLKKQDLSILASEGAPFVAPAPPELAGAAHDFPLVVLGVHLIDTCDLDALSEAAATRKRWDFLLTAAPLPIRGGTGSPINPIATF